MAAIFAALFRNERRQHQANNEIARGFGAECDAKSAEIKLLKEARDKAEDACVELRRQLDAAKKRPLSVEAQEILEDLARGHTTLRISVVQRINEDDYFLLSPRTTR